MPNYKQLILIIIIFCFALYFLTRNKQPIAGHLISGKDYQIINFNEFQPIIDNINQKNRNIKTFECNNMKIIFGKQRLIKAQSMVHYQKDKKLRLTATSIFGKELDIGSNDNYIWFWSKRLKPPAIYYSNYENLNKTRLKTPLNPIWLKSIIGFDEISTEQSVIAKRGDYLEVISVVKNYQNKEIIRSILIDPKTLLIIGHYLYDQNRLIASSEIYEFQLIDGYQCPKSILVSWVDENVTMVWELKECKINSNINESYWIMPSGNKIDMGLSLAKRTINSISS